MSGNPKEHRGERDMADTTLFTLDKIPEDRSIIVVSDLHLGGAEDPNTTERFCRFLEYIKTGFTTVPVSCHTCGEPEKTGPVQSKHLLPPKKIILLGDIFELWDSRNVDRNSAFLDGLRPFLRLRDLDCDVVYVTGNHDEDIAELITSCEAGNGKTKNETGGKTDQENRPLSLCEGNYEILYSSRKQEPVKAESLIFKWNESSKFEISRRHYPSVHVDGGKKGLEIGNARYAFIHGQQFDSQQITYTISEAFGQRFDPVDFLQDLASTSVSKQVGSIGMGILSGLFVVLAALFFLPRVQLLFPLAGGVIGAVFTVLFLAGAYIFGIRNRGLPSSGVMTAISFVIALIFLGAVIAGWVVPLFWFGFLVLLYLLAVIVIPRFFAGGKRWFYNNAISIRGQSPEKIITENLFDDTTYSYDSRVLIFGHTHVADFEKVKNKKVDLLVNTGSWVHEDKKGDPEDCDTFVYIDKKGICCLRWVDNAKNGEGPIRCLCRKKGDPKVDMPLCDYMVKIL